MPLRRGLVPGMHPNVATASAAAASIEPPRVTPRNSDGDEAIAALVKETPYGTLRQLANMPPKPTTPSRRASSAGPPSHHSLRRTPAGQARTPSGQRLGGSARRPNVLTPHGRAALREVESRRAGLTPAKDRRRSGRQQRETPRDVLRALSRVLAPKTQPVVPTPQGAVPTGRFTASGIDDLGDGDDDDDDALERPRLSLALEHDDDEYDSLLLPPRSAGLEDENYTIQSAELPRRATSEQPPGRLSRGSFGSIRMSDQFDVGGVFESSFAMGAPFDDDEIPGMDGGPREDLVALRGLDLDRGRTSLASGRDSDIRPLAYTGDDTENTFILTVPQRRVQEQPDENLLERPHEPPQRDEDGSDWDEADGMGAEHQDEVEDNELSTNRPKEADVKTRLHDTTAQNLKTSLEARKAVRKKNVKISKHGIQYPSLPAGVVKKLATAYARTSGNRKAKISKETLDAVMQASDWFFEQVSDDLGAYSNHAGRKTIDESDVVTLMRRQRQTNANTTPFSLAQRYLPRELLQELRMVPPSKLKKVKQLDRVEEAEEDYMVGVRDDEL